MSVNVPLEVLRAYFAKVIKPGGPDDCWLWPAHQLNGAGYGQLTIRLVKYGGRRRFLVHRLAYRLSVGPIPKGLQVLHECDVKRCVNPRHLSVGTQLQNESGKIKRGRSNRGQMRWSAKLTNDEAQQILNRCRTGELPQYLAEEYGVSVGIIYSIRSRRRWKFLKD